MGSHDLGSFLRTARDVAKDAAKTSTDALSADPRTAKHMERALQGAKATAKAIDKTRQGITQEEAWAQCSQAIEEIIDVLVVQQRLIEALSDKVSALEAGRDVPAEV